MVDPLPESYGPEYDDLLDRLVPDFGPANTVQGEVLRAALRVTSEYNRNGCGNWEADPEFFDGFVSFLLTHLCDGTFDAETESCVRQALGRVQEYGYRRLTLGTPETKMGLGNELDVVERVAVAWCLRHPEIIPWLSPEHPQT